MTLLHTKYLSIGLAWYLTPIPYPVRNHEHNKAFFELAVRFWRWEFLATLAVRYEEPASLSWMWALVPTLSLRYVPFWYVMGWEHEA